MNIQNEVRIEQAKFDLTVVDLQQFDLIVVLFSTRFQLRFVVAHFHIEGEPIKLMKGSKFCEREQMQLFHFMTSTTCS